MANISKKIDDWVTAGLINSDQGKSILDYEEEHRPKNLGVYSIIALGAIVICIGIISLIAANWDDIPDFVKLFMDFLVLGSLGFAIYKTRDHEKKIINELLILVYSLLSLASIGLISQIFHTGGELYQALGFWCTITLPLILHSTGKFNTHFWLLSFLYSVFTYIETEIKRDVHNDEILILYSISVISGLTLLGKILSKLNVDSLQRFGKTSLFWGTVFIMQLTIILSFFKNLTETPAYNWILGIYVISAIVVFYFEIQNDTKKAMIFGTGSALYLIFLSSHIFGFQGKFLDALFFILIWFALGFYFNLLGHRRLFEFTITAIGIRFLVVYFQLFASLALTGLGLIVSGIFIILLCVGYMKNREKILDKLGGII